MTIHAQRYRATRLISSLMAATAMIVMAGCKDLDVENLNGVSAAGFQDAPTAAQLVAAAQSQVSTMKGLGGTSGTQGYEYWSFRASEPRGLTNAVLSPNLGGSWSYGTIKNINLILDALNSVAGFTDAQKEGMRGWLKFALALQYEDMAQARDHFGVPITLQEDPVNDPPAPINTRDEVWAHVFTLMDQSYAHLGTPSAAFNFKIGSGWAGYNTPATMRPVNRAIKARWQSIYAVPAGRPGYTDAHWDGVLTSLVGTWINPTDPSTTTGLPDQGGTALTAAAMRVGPFSIYDASATNGANSVDRYSNGRIWIEAQCRVAGSIPTPPNAIPAGQNACAQDTVTSPATGTTFTYTPTNRDGRAFGANARVQALPQSQYSCLLLAGTIPICRHLRQTDPLSPTQSARIATTSPMPVIRNEELLLLRAEANLNKGLTSLAIRDINRVRQSGIAGLPPISDPYVANAALSQPATLEDAWLYEKRFSMWGENNTVWLDMRKYGKQNLIPHHDPSFRIFDFVSIPSTECDVRGYATLGCYAGGYAGIQGGPNLTHQPW